MSMHSRLREETRTNHSQIECVPLLKKIIDGQISLDDYQQLIIKFYGYISPCEKQINAVNSDISFDRQKLPLLIKDLLALGVESQAQADIELCHHLPDLTTRPGIIGYLYVMEGSTLGGQVISKILKNKLSLMADSGAAYFSGYGEQTKLKWNSFCQMLEIEADKCDQAIIIKSANEVFTTLHHWMLSA